MVVNKLFLGLILFFVSSISCANEIEVKIIFKDIHFPKISFYCQSDIRIVQECNYDSDCVKANPEKNCDLKSTKASILELWAPLIIDRLVSSQCVPNIVISKARNDIFYIDLIKKKLDQVVFNLITGLVSTSINAELSFSDEAELYEVISSVKNIIIQRYINLVLWNTADY